MSNLNVALILRLVDRLSAPARTAAASVRSIATQAAAAARAAARLSAAAARAAAAAQNLGGAANTAGQANQTLANAAAQAAAAAAAAAAAQANLANSTNQAGNAANRAGPGFSRLERLQRRAAAAGRTLRGQMNQLNGRLGSLAMASIATQGMDQAGQAVMAPLKRSVVSATSFNLGMTGIGVTADLSDAQLKPLRASIFETAQQFGLANERALAVYASVLNEGAYRGAADLMRAGKSVAGFQKLAEVGGDPLSDQETGALTSAFAYSLGAGAGRLNALLAQAFRSSQLGGTRAGAVARALPEQLGILKGFGGGDDRNYVSLLAANQIVKRAAGTDEQATIYTKDFLSALAQAHTMKRFGESGIDLQTVISTAKAKGLPVIDAVIDAVSGVIDKKLLESGDNGAIEQFLISKLLINQQSAGAMRALLQNRADFKRFQAEIGAPQAQPNYEANLDRVSKTPSADYQRKENAQNRLGIATGDILAPVTRKAAGVMGGVAGAMAKMEEKGGLAGKIGVYAISGFAGLAVAIGWVGKAVVGIAGPILILQTLSKMLPTAAAGARAGLLARSLLLLGRAGGLLGGAFGWVLRIGPWIARLGGLVIPVAEAIGGALVVVGEAIAAIAAGLSVGWIVAIVAAVVAAGVGIWQAVTHWDAVKAWVAGFWGWLRGAFGGLVRWIGSAGGSLISGLIGGIVGMAGRLKSAVVGVAHNVAQWFRERLGIHSPSRVFAAIGGFSMEGLAVGLAAAARRPLRQAAALSAALVGAFGSPALAADLLPLRARSPVVARPVEAAAVATAPVRRAALPALAGVEVVSRASPALPPLAGAPVRAAASLAPAAIEVTPRAPPPATAPAPAPAMPQTRQDGPRTVVQHFHVEGGGHDAHTLARELKRLGEQGERRALHDGAAE